MPQFFPVPAGVTITPPLRVLNKFKYYDIMWQVENFCLHTCEEDWEVSSPGLVGPQGSKLELILKCSNSEDIANATVSFVVRRPVPDAGPETLWVNYRVCVSDTDIAAKHLKVEKLCSLNSGSESETDLAGLSGIFDETKNLMTKVSSLSIKSKIIVYAESGDLGLEECREEGLRTLSEDMSALFETGRGCDAELKIGDSSLRIHKAVLCARCEWFDSILDQEVRRKRSESVITVDLSNTVSNNHCEGMRKIVAFLYSGNLKHVLEKPSLSIGDLVSLLEVEEIKRLYTPEVLHFLSTVDAQEFEFDFCIENFNAVCSTDARLLSPVFAEVNSSRTWRFHFYPRAGDDSGFVALFAETSEEIESMNMCLVISVIADGECLNVTKMLRKRLETGSTMFGLTNYEYKNWIKYYAVGDVLNLSVKVMLSAGRRSSIVMRHSIPTLTVDQKTTSYDTLSLQMKEMLENGVFYDSELETSDGCLLVHKCILAIRCNVLYDMLMKHKENSPLMVEDIRQGALLAVLTYVYSGAVRDVRAYEVDEISAAADNFKIPQLKEFCRTFPTHRSLSDEEPVDDS